MKKQDLINIIKEEVQSVVKEFVSNDVLQQIKDRISKSDFSGALQLIYNLAKHRKIDDNQFKILSNILKSKANLRETSLINEMSLRDIKTRIREMLDLEEVQQYKVDNFNYENIPFEIFQANGVMPLHLKQYKQSGDIITYDLGIEINPIAKNVDVFLQKSGIFN